MAERDDLLRQVQAAQAGGDVAAAVMALDAYDRRRTASLQQSRETDLSAADVRRTLEPLPAFERHTAATDWIGEYEAPTDFRTAMITEASKWYRSVPREVLADREEFEEQALGHAYTAASAYGDSALAARREFMQYVGYLTSTGASGLPQIQQTEDPQDNPAPTPLDPQVFDNFAPEQNEYNGVEGDNHDSQISSQQAPGIQALEQQDAGGSGFGSGPERPVEHSTQMDTSNSYAEVPLGPPGQIPANVAGPAPSAPSTPNPIAGQQMDEGAEKRQTVSASFSLPDHEGFRWRITAASDPEALNTPYHEKCGSLHWPEEACHNGHEHTASVAVGYLMNAEEFTRRAHFEHQGAAEGQAALGTGDRRRVVAHHNAIVAAFQAEARTEDEIAWLHGYMARVRPVLAGGGDAFGGKQAPPFGKKKKKKGKGKDDQEPKEAARGVMPDFPLAAEAAAAGDSVPLRICPQCGSTYCKHWQGRDKPYDLPGEPYGTGEKTSSMAKGAPFAGYKDFAACVAANQDKRDPEAYCGKIKHQVEGQVRTAGNEDEDADEADASMHAYMHRTGPVTRDLSYRDWAANRGGQHEGASSLPQIQETTDSHDNPDPQGDQLNPATMFPLIPAFGGQGEDEGKPAGKQAARDPMQIAGNTARMFGRMDAIEGHRAQHKDKYVFSDKAHGQYLRGWNETAGVIHASAGAQPMGAQQYGDMTGRPDLHKHYLGVYHSVAGDVGEGGFPKGLRAVPVGQGLKGYPGKEASIYYDPDHEPVNPLLPGIGAPHSGPGPNDMVHDPRGFLTFRTPVTEYNGRTLGDTAREQEEAYRRRQRDEPDPEENEGPLRPHHQAPEPSHFFGSRHTADTLTRPHQSTDDDHPPFNTPATSPDPWSSNSGGGDFAAGQKEGREDAANGEKPTFSDNSSMVSPYVQGYAQGYFGGQPAAGAQDVPHSIGGDSGQAMNAGEAAKEWELAKAGSLQRTAACIGCGHPSHLGQPCNSLGCRHYHNPGEEGAGPGMHARTIGHVPDPGAPGYSMAPGSQPSRGWGDDYEGSGNAHDDSGYESDYGRYEDGRDLDPGGRHSGSRRTAHDFTEEQREDAAHSLGPEHKLPVNSKQDLANAHRRAHQVEGIPESTVENYLSRLDTEYGKTGRRVSAAFITREAAAEPDFVKAYRFGIRWAKGMPLIRRGSAAFEAGLYSAIADRPAIQQAWVQAHLRQARRYPEMADRLDVHASFSRKVAAQGNGHRVSGNGYYLVRMVPKAAATSVDLITDGPGTSPDPMGSTPLNGPGQPPPMGGQEDPAASGGPPPYQQTEPAGHGPVAPDDVLGTPQAPPSESGPFTQTFSGRHPGNATLAPVAPNLAGGSGYSNTDAEQGDPRHKQQQALAFRRTVQANLAARRARQSA